MAPSADGLIIRRYAASDEEQVRALFASGMLSHAPKGSDHEDAFATYVNYCLKFADFGRFDDVYDTAKPDSLGIGAFFVAVTPEGEIQGMVGLQARGDLEATAELRRMSVAEGARGTGIGRRLVTHLEDWARSHGFRRVVLTTGATIPAGKFYQAMGYTLTSDLLVAVSCDNSKALTGDEAAKYADVKTAGIVRAEELGGFIFHIHEFAKSLGTEQTTNQRIALAA